MNAHKISVTLTADGQVTLKGLPFQAGETVEVIVLEQSARSQPSSLSDQDYLEGIANTLSEWDSEADQLAYEDL
ncbi:hypothetical protein [Dactylococcopsis salina]|uniref:Uncharacterized protein n=1 Tax=Dactylococcopsis salina (strain PCC 8305) TaxID=13035 RepID=K9YU14_DACS8|nr:hypothetical protein [Dactylococcopsis salina]AFZ50384.1 hypothetical protein Dacsa_1720 [Dactylococcopsis salina PCC 8305]